jgi:hypothetical protein
MTDIAATNDAVMAAFPDLLPSWLPGGRKEGREFIALNPRRADNRLGSFKINVDTGKWSDFATGDKGGDPISLYAYINNLGQFEAAQSLASQLSLETTPAKPVSGAGEEIDTPLGDDAIVQPQGCTLQQYAVAKHLPEPFLAKILAETNHHGKPALRIPYRDSNGAEKAVRWRSALSGNHRFLWNKNDKPFLYGLDRLKSNADYVVMVEGESDCHTLWYHEINAVGLPGAQAWKDERDAPHLAPYEIIYAVVELDQGGDAVVQSLSKSKIRSRVRIVHLNDFKDVSEMHIAHPSLFRERLQTALDQSKSLLDLAEQQSKAERDAAWSECGDLSNSPNILDIFWDDLQKSGVVGEERSAKLICLAVTSRVLERPVSVAVKGPSSAGKSFLTSKVLSFFAPEASYVLTAMSEKALVYGDEPLKHRMLVINEADGVSGEMQSMLLRVLLSEGCIKYETVEKTADGIRPRRIEREGPTGLITTTTKTALHPENETRLLSITITDEPKHTQAILRAIAQGGGEQLDLKRWHSLQTAIGLSDASVVVPYLEKVFEMVPPTAVRMRRDGTILKNLIKANAILHQKVRTRDKQGRIIATLEDYRTIYGLVADVLAEAMDAIVPKPVRETVNAVADIVTKLGDHARVIDVAARLKIHKSAASRRCKRAADLGYICNGEQSKGREAKYIIQNPLPDDEPVLPHPERVKAAVKGDRLATKETGCTVAGDQGGECPLGSIR